MRRAYIFVCPAGTSAFFLIWRLRFEDFFVRMWRRPGWLNISFPVPVALNLALTAFRVFIFGTVYSFNYLFDTRG